MYYRLYLLEHTSIINYETSDKTPLDFNCQEDSVKNGINVDFGTPLICNTDSFKLRFLSPVTRIDPHIFSKTVTNIRLTYSDSLIYASSPNICVASLKEIKGRDVIDNRFLVSKEGILIAAAVADLFSAKVPNNVSYIGDGAFQACHLKELIIPANVKSIGENAFANCDYMQSLTIESKDPVLLHEATFNETTLEGLTIYVPKRAVKGYKKIYPYLKDHIKRL